MRDMHSNIKTSPALNPQTISTDTTTAGATIDRAGYDSLEFSIQSGTVTDGTYTPVIYEGDASNMSDETATADADLIGLEADAAFVGATAADDNACKRIGYKGNKRYVRLKLVSASASSGGAFSAQAIQGHPLKAPVA